MGLTDISDYSKSASMKLANYHFQVEDAESLLKAMASQCRLLILCEVLKGERTVTELHQALGAQYVVDFPTSGDPQRRKDRIHEARVATCVLFSRQPGRRKNARHTA